MSLAEMSGTEIADSRPMVISFTLDWVLVPFNSNFLEYFNFLKGGSFSSPPGSQGEKKTLVLKGLSNDPFEEIGPKGAIKYRVAYKTY